jgi:hypothetical protein
VAVSVMSSGGYPASTWQHLWHSAQWSNNTFDLPLGNIVLAVMHQKKTELSHQVWQKVEELLTVCHIESRND